MKILGVIPARYESSRFPGKPIADLCGKPMIWWIYSELSKIDQITEVVIATDDSRIVEVCDKHNMKSILTSSLHKTHIERLCEVSKKIEADLYINVNGDEPLITANAIRKIIPTDVETDKYYFANMMTEIKDPVEVADTSKIKIAVDSFSYGMYMARYPIPFPKGRGDIIYNKFVGVQCFTKEALEFSLKTKRGYIESCEDIDEYRYLENGEKILFVKAEVENLSVDTPKDLIKAAKMMRKRIGVQDE